MGGMPRASRSTAAGAFKPVALSEPSKCGREDLAAQINQVTTATTASRRTSRIALTTRSALDRRVLGGERVTVAMNVEAHTQNIALFHRIKMFSGSVPAFALAQ